jgi:hypothetical protein
MLSARLRLAGTLFVRADRLLGGEFAVDTASSVCCQWWELGGD